MLGSDTEYLLQFSSMQYTVDRQDKGKVSIKVDLPQAIFDETYGQVLTEFKKETKIAGFRPGMAPDDIVEGHVGSNKILNEAASYLISKNLSDIFKKEELVPIDNPKIAMDTLAKGSPLSFTATFTLRPKVKIGDWKQVKVERIKAKDIKEEDVANSIKNIYEAYQKSQRDKEPAAGGEPRPDGREEPKAEEAKFIYDARGNKIPLVDEGKNKVEAHKIDDEFAKKIGARDLDHLRELVKKDLETLVTDQVESDYEQKVFDAIADLVEVEVPEVLIDDELNRILVRLGTELERQGKTLEDFLKEENTDIEGLKAKWREQATKNVKISMAMDEIGKEAKIQVTKEELDAAAAGVNQTSMSADQKRDLENYLVVSIFQAKTLDLVKRTIAGTEVPTSQAKRGEQKDKGTEEEAPKAA
ncbi:MAG TPA: trigger factor [Chlamydiales bacterium]|nr:trigger factor [Chlamydiales bacterium]